MEPLYKQFSTSAFDENGELIEFSLHYEDNFNFAYDVVDAIAAKEPDKRAIQWCDESGAEKMLTFGDISRLSSQAAAYLLDRGVRNGDRVMLMLKRHYEYWYMAMALHKGFDGMLSDEQYAKYYWKDLKACIETAQQCGLIAQPFCEGKYNTRLKYLADIQPDR